MGEQTRETLRGFFKAGQLPTEDHFGDLIDSMLNMKDEGFSKSPENGLEVAAAAGKDALLSFYRDNDPGNPIWSMRYGAQNNRLELRQGDGRDGAAAPALMSLGVDRLPPAEGRPASAHPRVGVNIEHPRHTLDVAGVLASQGRLGSFPRDGDPNASAADNQAMLTVPANGVWQTIVDKLRGCHAFEVMAGVGGTSGSGQFALLHAVALNTYNPVVNWFDLFNPKRRIRATSAHYGRRCDQLQLCWEGKNGKDADYRLRIRTRCPYDGEVQIRYAVTRLWFDPEMASCRRPADAGLR